MSSFLCIWPELILCMGIILIFLFIIFTKKDSYPSAYLWISIITLLSYWIVNTFFYQSPNPNDAFSGLLKIDKLAIFSKQVLSISVLFGLVQIRLFNYKFDPEVYIFILGMVLGLAVSSMSTHFITIFTGLEIASFATYGMVILPKTKANYEAVLKYFLIGAVATAIMLFAVSYFYGLSFELSFGHYSSQTFENQNPMAIQVLCLMYMAIVLFKTAAVPFHTWVADVYEQAPTPILSFLSFAPKLVGFVIISRFISTEIVDFRYLLFVLAFASLLIGNLSALWQQNTKRLLAFSGVAHTGFILIGFIFTRDHFSPFYYLICYLPMTAAAFWFVDLSHRLFGSHEISKLTGVGQKHMLLSVNIIIIMVSLAGIPPTIGFSAKLVLFGQLLSNYGNENNGLLIAALLVGLLNVAISIYYYLRLPYTMFILKPIDTPTSEKPGLNHLVLTFLALLLVVLFFISDQISPLVESIFK